MKTIHFIFKNQISKKLVACLFLIFAISFTTLEAQERTVKGTITAEDGPLQGVNIILNGTRVGISTDAKGQFTFPRALKPGDVLLISYLGYETQRVTIGPETNAVTLQLTEDMIDVTGNLASDKLFKSKRKQ